MPACSKTSLIKLGPQLSLNCYCFVGKDLTKEA